MSNEPLVSVIMSVHNCGPYIEEALGSILVQTYKNLEVIIFDDGSTDETGAIIEKMAKQDDRIFAHYRNQQGIANCLNEALNMAKGEFIARMDGDDISLPDRIEKQLKFLCEHPKVDLVGCWLKLFGDRDEIWHYRSYDNFIKNMFLMFTNGVGHNAILVRGDVYRRYRYDPEYTDVEDTELWTRMATSIPAVCFANLREVLVLYRIHGGQSSVLKKTRQYSLYKKIIKNYLLMLGMNECDVDMKTHEMLVNNLVPLTNENLLKIAAWLNFLKERINLEDEFGVLSERWHSICSKHNVDLSMYKMYASSIQVCWLPKKFHD